MALSDMTLEELLDASPRVQERKLGGAHYLIDERYLVSSMEGAWHADGVWHAFDRRGAENQLPLGGHGRGHRAAVEKIAEVLGWPTHWVMLEPADLRSAVTRATALSITDTSEHLINIFTVGRFRSQGFVTAECSCGWASGLHSFSAGLCLDEALTHIPSGDSWAMTQSGAR